MDSRRKRLRTSTKCNDPDNKDRISSLPDEAIAHILSFLPTRFSVATSVLSSRWKNLFQLNSNLDLDYSMSFDHSKGQSDARRIASIKRFVTRVFARDRKFKVSKFRLKCTKNVDQFFCTQCLKAAFTYQIPELELVFKLAVPYLLEIPHLACQYLVVLKLESRFVLQLPNPPAFPHLRVLFLNGIQFSADCCFSELLCKSPLLEELVIEGCDWHGGDLFITNPFLKRLTLDVGLSGPLDQLTGCRVYFNVPSLTYLKYHESLAEEYLIENMNSIVEADIDVCFYDDDDDDELQCLCDAMLDLIKGVQSCKIMYLSGQCLEALTSGDFELPVFPNLIQLRLGLGCDFSWSDVLFDLLNSSPCLEALTFVEVVSCLDISLSDYQYRFSLPHVLETVSPFFGGIVGWNDLGCTREKLWVSKPEVPSCVNGCLKLIDMKHFRGLRVELDIVMYFLQSAKVLEELVIYWWRSTVIPIDTATDISAIEKEIKQLPKASKTCSITFR